MNAAWARMATGTLRCSVTQPKAEHEDVLASEFALMASDLRLALGHLACAGGDASDGKWTRCANHLKVSDGYMDRVTNTRLRIEQIWPDPRE